MKKIALIMAALVVASIFAGCSKSEEPASTGTTGTTAGGTGADKTGTDTPK